MEKVWLQHYEKNMAHEIDLGQYNSINEIFAEAFIKFADRPAFHNMGTTISFADLDRLGDTFADFLQNELQLVKGDVIALMMPNILQYPIAILGAMRAGLTIVNCNPLYTARELEYQLKDSKAKAIVIFENSASVLQSCLHQTSINHVIVTQVGDLLSFPKNIVVNVVVKYVKKMIPTWSIPGVITFPAALKRGQSKRLRPVNLGHKDIAFLQYTGGTTGVSKGAILTHRNIIANLLQVREWVKNILVPGQEVVIAPLPLYHIFSLTVNFLVFGTNGALNVLITNPRDVPAFLGELRKWKYTVMIGVNSLFNLLMLNKEFHALDFSSMKLTFAGGMAVQHTVAERWQKLTKCPIVEGYGLTETSPAACLNILTNKDFNGFIGIPIPSTTVDIRDDDNHPLPVGEIGELCIKGPQVMDGYWGQESETAKVFTPDGYFKTGDLGFMTADGHFKIVDRKKDMILVSGFNVYPNEVEDVMMTHPGIAECAAIGIADARSTEVVKLVVVKSDPKLTESEIIAFAREQLTAYKVPKVVEFRDSLPKSNVGKVLRKDLRSVG